MSEYNQMMDVKDKDNDKGETPSKGAAVVLMIVIIAIVILWITSGIVAVVCVGRQGGFLSQFFGLLIAVLFGPFYWIYFLLHKQYCKPYSWHQKDSGQQRQRIMSDL